MKNKYRQTMGVKSVWFSAIILIVIMAFLPNSQNPLTAQPVTDTAGDVFSMHWPQMPKPPGWDIGFAGSKLADDFLCTGSGHINHVRFWIAMHNNDIQEIDHFVLSFWNSVYQAKSFVPGQQLWLDTINFGEFVTTPMPGMLQGWFDPSTQSWSPGNTQTWFELTVNINNNPFIAEIGNSYWIRLDFGDKQNIGWKESEGPLFGSPALFQSGLSRGWVPLFNNQVVPNLPIDLAFVLTEEDPLTLDVTATPDSVCSGEPVQLHAMISGGSGNYKLTWFSIPPGFEDTTNNFCPVVNPELPTTYYLVLWDGTTWLADSAKVFVPVVSCPGNMEVCLNEAPFPLTGGIPEGGIYSGNGVLNGMFYPAIAQEGYHIITYYINDLEMGCNTFCYFSIFVKSIPLVSCPSNMWVIPIEPPFLLTGGVPEGGIYSGKGVSNGVFFPQVADTGDNIITYTVIDPVTECSNYCTFIIYIPPNCCLNQVISYETGWRWISFNVLPLNKTVNKVMEEFPAMNGDILKNQTQTMFFNGTTWIPNLTIDPDRTYLLKTSNPGGSFNVYGDYVDFSDPIPVNACGWTWIAYKPILQYTPKNAFTLTTGSFTNQDIVKNQTQTAIYNSTLNNWIPTSFKMNPGSGYKLKYQSAVSGMLKYPAADNPMSPLMENDDRVEVPTKAIYGDPGWVPAPGMETNMSIFIKSVTLDKIPVTNGKIAAFDSKTNQCRAVEEFFDTDGSGQAIITVGFNSEETGNSFYYLVWNSVNNMIYRANETGVMISDDFRTTDLTLISKIETGTSNATSPLANTLTFDLKGKYLPEIQFSQLSTLGSKARANNIKIFPNPTRGVFIIEGMDEIASVNIFDALGGKIYSGEPESSSVNIDLSTQPRGIYFIRIETDTNVFFEKLMLK